MFGTWFQNAYVRNLLLIKSGLFVVVVLKITVTKLFAEATWCMHCCLSWTRKSGGGDFFTITTGSGDMWTESCNWSPAPIFHWHSLPLYPCLPSRMVRLTMTCLSCEHHSPAGVWKLHLGGAVAQQHNICLACRRSSVQSLAWTAWKTSTWDSTELLLVRADNDNLTRPLVSLPIRQLHVLTPYIQSKLAEFSGDK